MEEEERKIFTKNLIHEKVFIVAACLKAAKYTHTQTFSPTINLKMYTLIKRSQAKARLHRRKAHEKGPWEMKDMVSSLHEHNKQFFATNPACEYKRANMGAEQKVLVLKL